jgi:AcrR family transcriptional regulator
MARPRRFSDEKILEVARSVFVLEGASVSTQRIADRLGMSQPALFKRFGNKETLLRRALLPQTQPTFLDRIEHGPDERSIPDQLVEIGIQTLASLQDLIPRINVLRSAGLQPLDLISHLGESPPLRYRRLMVEWFERARTQGRVAELDFGTISDLVVGALQRRVFLGAHAPDFVDDRPDKEFVGGVIRALWCGLAPVRSCDGERCDPPAERSRG